MIFNELRIAQTISDEKFDTIYPESIQKLAFDHFTPVEVAQTAAQFLVRNAQTKVLDIGSGAGKFCFVGAICTEGQFTGVELREDLHLVANQIAKKHQLANVTFLHSNITQIDFSEYQAFYFYNSWRGRVCWSRLRPDTHRTRPWGPQRRRKPHPQARGTLRYKA